jgi:hypothetical protein
MLDLPALPGAYVLELFLPQDADLAIGRLGRARFPMGALFYLGRKKTTTHCWSALGGCSHWRR